MSQCPIKFGRTESFFDERKEKLGLLIFPNHFFPESFFWEKKNQNLEKIKIGSN